MVKLNFRCSCVILLGVVAAASAAASERPATSIKAPKITSVSKIGTTRLQTITIKGTGFGTHKPYTGDTTYISLRELHPGCPHDGVCWEAGYSPDVDTVTLIVKSWTNTEIVLGGFGTAWGRQDWTLHKGYTEQFWVWDPQHPGLARAVFKAEIQ
jgi:hypothetical protein